MILQTTIALVYLLLCFGSSIGQENVLWQHLRRRSLPLEVVEANAPSFSFFAMGTPYMLANMNGFMKIFSWSGIDSSASPELLVDLRPRSKTAVKEEPTKLWQWLLTKFFPVPTALFLLDEPMKPEHRTRANTIDDQTLDFVITLDTRRRLFESLTFPIISLARTFVSMFDKNDEACCLIAADECNPQHLVCEQVVDLVCGCDGNTYINACFARYFYCNSNWTIGRCSDNSTVAVSDLQLRVHND